MEETIKAIQHSSLTKLETEWDATKGNLNTHKRRLTTLCNDLNIKFPDEVNVTCRPIGEDKISDLTLDMRLFMEEFLKTSSELFTKLESAIQDI